MNGVCLCGGDLGNLGTPLCPPMLGKLLWPIFQSTYQSNGTVNSINPLATLNKAFFDALQYHADTDIRWYPLAIILEDVEAPKGETIYKTYGSGRTVKVRQGMRSIKGTGPIVAAPIVEKINGRGCSKQSAYWVTTEGILGIYKSDGLFYGIQLAQDSLDAMLMLQNETDPQSMTLMMQWAQSTNEGQLAIIPWSAIASDIDIMTQLGGKLDTNIKQLAAARSTTTFTVDLFLDYGTAVRRIPVENLVTADFSLYNDTDALSVVITSATEDPLVPGRYAFVIPAQTVTDLLTLSLASTAATKPFAYESWDDVSIALQ